MANDLTEADLQYLATRGIDAGEALAQLALLRSEPVPPRILRAASRGDGILQLSAEERDMLAAEGTRAAQDGALSFFVPASGAASRMFISLEQLRAGTHPEPAAEESRLRRTLSAPALQRAFAERGLLPAAEMDLARLLSTLLEPAPTGLGWSQQPKAFLPFHLADAAGSPTVTAFEEQVREIAALGARRFVLHVTLPESRLSEAGNLEARLRGIAPEATLSVSVQSTSTETVSIDETGDPVRDDRGNPLLRAGGHGALLANLGQTPGEVVLLKNIDNIQPWTRHAETVRWRGVLAGLCLRLRRAGDALLRSTPGSPEEASAARDLAPLLERAGLEPPGDTGALRRLVDRPIRVAGMIANQGDPGGAPVWTESAEGPSLQIVEQSEVPAGHPAKPVLEKAPFFNPVDMACAFRHPDGTPRRLADFADPRRSFVSRKSYKGAPLLALEKPGLWNGSMAGWLSVFVELPESVFLPAKTFHDLADPRRTGAE